MGCILLFLFYSEQNPRTDVVVQIILAAGLRQEDDKLEASLGYSVRLCLQNRKRKKPKPGTWHVIIALVLGRGTQNLSSLAGQPS